MYRYGTFAVVLLFIPGCFLFPIPGQTGDPTGSSELTKFESEKELTDYFVGQITGRNGDIDREAGFARAESDTETTVDGAPQAPSDADFSADTTGAGASGMGAGGDDGSIANSGAVPAPPGSFSGTTLQELGVDEADVVKTDGDFLYIITNQTLKIVRVTPREAFNLVSTTPLEGTGREIYLHDGSVIALSETYGTFFGVWGGGGIPEPGILIDEVALVDPAMPVDDPAATDTPDAAGTDDSAASTIEVDGVPADAIAPPEFEYRRPSTYVTILDVSTPEDPVEISRTRFDGIQASSRMIDGVMRLVVAVSQYDYFDVLPMLGLPELDLSNVDDKDLLPAYEQRIGDTTTSGQLLTWQDVYRPTDPDGFGIVAVITMDTKSRSGAFSAVGVVAEPGLIYSSTEALYLTDYWNLFGDTQRDTTDIYKFAYEATGAVPVATGTVPGRIDSQYSMDEYQGKLRVATTLTPVFGPVGFFEMFDFFAPPPEPTNAVYVLEPQESKLAIVGRIEGIAPGERLKSARFLDDRGFVVTFREIDPLFTLNLADPYDPKIEGQLKVPGFSTFMVPMDRDHLLTVGQYVPEDGFFLGRGVQLSVFDVSSLQQPTLTHSEVIGDTGYAYSEALFNPKAFTYFAEQSLVALPIVIDDYGFDVIDGPVITDIAVDGQVIEPDPTEPPATDAGMAAEDVYVPQNFEGLLVYRVSTGSGFESLGRISTRYDDNLYGYTAFTRGVFIDDDVFAVTNRGVRCAALSDLTTVTHEQRFQDALPDDLYQDVPGETTADGVSGEAIKAIR